MAIVDGPDDDLPPHVDYLTPVIADGDTGKSLVRYSDYLFEEHHFTIMNLILALYFEGHGGLSAVMKLTKLFIEAGAAGIHFEDQKPGNNTMIFILNRI